MAKIFVTRRIPERGIEILKSAGHDVTVSAKDGVLTKEELVRELKQQPYDAVLCLLTDTIDGEILDAAPSAKIFANYAVGFNNVDVAEAKKRGVVVSNTPEVLTETVAEHTIALLLAIACRIPEGDRFMRAGRYTGWGPLDFLGTDLKEKTIGILGAGRIGARVLHHATRGFDMKALYYDIKRNDYVEKEYGAEFRETPEALLKDSDFVSVHVPLLPTTKHLINKERLAMMKKGAYLVNSSRGPVIDEVALVEALRSGVIRGAALDVYEFEPKMAPGLSGLDNVVLTPHIASATEETRARMAEIAATNILAVLGGSEAPNAIRS